MLEIESVAEGGWAALGNFARRSWVVVRCIEPIWRTERNQRANLGSQASNDGYGGLLLYHMGDMVEALSEWSAGGV